MGKEDKEKIAFLRNILYEKQGRSLTNEMASRVQTLFQTDTALMGYYNRTFADGRWNHFMDQAHLGYNSWRDPPINNLNAIKLNRIELRDTSIMGISIEGTESVWPDSLAEAILPDFDIFNHCCPVKMQFRPYGTS